MVMNTHTGKNCCGSCSQRLSPNHRRTSSITHESLWHTCHFHLAPSTISDLRLRRSTCSSCIFRALKQSSIFIMTCKCLQALTMQVSDVRYIRPFPTNHLSVVTRHLNSPGPLHRQTFKSGVPSTVLFIAAV